MKKIIGIMILCAMLPVIIVEATKFDIVYQLLNSIDNSVIYLICYGLAYAIMNAIFVVAVYLYTSDLEIDPEKTAFAENISYIYLIVEIVLFAIPLLLGLYEGLTWEDVPTDEIMLSHHLNLGLSIASYIVSVAACVCARNCKTNRQRIVSAGNNKQSIM